MMTFIVSELFIAPYILHFLPLPSAIPLKTSRVSYLVYGSPFLPRDLLLGLYLPLHLEGLRLGLMITCYFSFSPVL